MCRRVAGAACNLPSSFIRVASGPREFLLQLKTAEVPYLTGQLGLGGAPGYIHFFFEDSFAEINKGSPVARALGAEGAEKVNAKMAGIVTHMELWVARYLPEVSYDNRRAGPSNQD